MSRIGSRALLVRVPNPLTSARFCPSDVRLFDVVSRDDVPRAKLVGLAESFDLWDLRCAHLPPPPVTPGSSGARARLLRAYRA